MEQGARLGRRGGGGVYGGVAPTGKGRDVRGGCERGGPGHVGYEGGGGLITTVILHLVNVTTKCRIGW